MPFTNHIIFFFFFQAEDGIRDHCVTGVQTCALPICCGVLADAPNRLWVTDITEHPTAEGKVYCAAVMDAYSRLIVGWSIADHMRTELVTDALGMAILRRQPDSQGAIVYSDHGGQYTSCA